jgi:hypothetical protein
LKANYGKFDFMNKKESQEDLNGEEENFNQTIDNH